MILLAIVSTGICDRSGFPPQPIAGPFAPDIDADTCAADCLIAMTNSPTEYVMTPVNKENPINKIPTPRLFTPTPPSSYIVFYLRTLTQNGNLKNHIRTNLFGFEPVYHLVEESPPPSVS